MYKGEIDSPGKASSLEINTVTVFPTSYLVTPSDPSILSLSLRYPSPDTSIDDIDRPRGWGPD